MVISLAQWVFDNICEVQEFSIKMDDIILMGNPTKEMIEYYNEAIERNKKPRKMKTVARKDMYSNSDDELDDMSDEEMELLKSVLDGLKDTKRKLH
jgi:hypothetical protein